MADEKKVATAAAKKNSSKKKVTVDGIDVTIDVDSLNDLEFLDMIDEVQSGNVFRLPKLLKFMFGNEWDNVKNSLADKNGRVSADTAVDFFTKVLDEAGRKNS